jgi:hypothetical protein
MDKAVKGEYYVRHPNGIVSYLMARERAWDYAQDCRGIPFRKVSDDLGVMIQTKEDTRTPAMPKLLMQKGSLFRNMSYPTIVLLWFAILWALATYVPHQ